jgi:thiol-disulfide isomerase/thioredoxin
MVLPIYNNNHNNYPQSTLMKISLCFLLFFTLSSCNQSETSPLAPGQLEKISIVGLWRGVLTSPGGELPFGIDIRKNDNVLTAIIINGEEQVETSSVEYSNNQLTINFEWYDARISAKLEDNNKLVGQWSKTASGENKTSSLPFSATQGYSTRFTQEKLAANHSLINGQWEVTFTDEDGDSIAVAEFQQQGQIVNGTFLTPTGDYRYLSGVANNGKLYLSAFDGAHAFLFNAQIKDNLISNGNFWSRDSYHATWTALKSDKTADFLPNSWEMNQTTTEVSFAFEDTKGNLIQLTDEQFKNKPVLINLFGTWCPNCNDEAPVLAKLYDKYNSQGLEIVGLAFEFTEDSIRDKKQIDVFKKRHAINYPLLLAGGNDKSEATKILGFLDEVKSYPTTIFLDKNHKVVKIHTGFSGPGTGEHYTKLIEELENEINSLLIQTL